MPQYINAINQALLDAFKRWEQEGDNWFNVDLPAARGVIQVAAEIIIDLRARKIALFDIAVYPKDNNFPIGTAAKEIREALRDLRDILHANGFSGVIIGQRANNSSSALPGRHVSMAI